MSSSAYYRDKADRCRLMLALAVIPEIREQLRIWERDFDQMADLEQRRQERLQRLRSWRNRLRSTFRQRAMP